MPKALFNPKNYAPDTGGSFKEGLVRVDQSFFAVVKGGGTRGNNVSLVWIVTRMEDPTHPILNAENEETTERLHFSLGGQSLAFVHPGKADSFDDEDIEDLGFELNTEGNTLFLVPNQDKDFQTNPKSGIAHLYDSLRKAGYKDQYLDREWASDFVGLTAFLKSIPGEGTLKDEKGVERPWSYKVVDKILQAPYEKKGAAKGAAAGAGASSNGKDAEAELKLKPILEAIGAEMTGEVVSKKALAVRVGQALQKAGIDPKLHVPITSLVKDDAWLKKNAAKYDMVVDTDENTIAFA